MRLSHLISIQYMRWLGIGKPSSPSETLLRESRRCRSTRAYLEKENAERRVITVPLLPRSITDLSGWIAKSKI